MENKNQTSEDIAHGIAKALMASLPVVGPLVYELFGMVVTPPIEKRRIEWMNDISAKLQDLADRKGFDIATLSSNDSFIYAVVTATTIALRTSDKEKILALQNIVLKVSTQSNHTEDYYPHIFLNLIDTLTGLHIKVLKFFVDAGHYADVEWIKGHFPGEHGAKISDIYAHVNRDWDGDVDLLSKISKDLFNQGLIIGWGADADIRTLNTLALKGRGATPLGENFINYIREYSA